MCFLRLCLSLDILAKPTNVAIVGLLFKLVGNGFIYGHLAHLCELQNNNHIAVPVCPSPPSAEEFQEQPFLGSVSLDGTEHS